MKFVRFDEDGVILEEIEVESSKAILYADRMYKLILDLLSGIPVDAKTASALLEEIDEN